VPAFAERSPVAQPRLPGPPPSAFAARPPVVQRHGAGGAFSVNPGQIGLASSGGRPLPEAVRGKMESALGADFSGVRVYVGPQAERIGAIAFTIGSDIYFAPGRYHPDTAHGQQLLGHELAHVVQQRAGRVRNPLGSGIAVVQDHALEAEADRLGHRAATHPVEVHRVEVEAKLPPGAVQPVRTRPLDQARAAAPRVLSAAPPTEPKVVRRQILRATPLVRPKSVPSPTAIAPPLNRRTPSPPRPAMATSNRNVIARWTSSKPRSSLAIQPKYYLSDAGTWEQKTDVEDEVRRLTGEIATNANLVDRI
jgi:hypothetical protein